MVTIISGYFDPLHIGHLDYINKAVELKNLPLIVIINNDYQAEKKKGKAFMKDTERMKIVQSIKGVNEAVMSIDYDKSVSKTINRIRDRYKGFDIIFANGGDQKEKCLEEDMCNKLGIKVVYGLGNKIQSSSELIWKSKN